MPKYLIHKTLESTAIKSKAPNLSVHDAVKPWIQPDFQRARRPISEEEICSSVPAIAPKFSKQRSNYGSTRRTLTTTGAAARPDSTSSGVWTRKRAVTTKIRRVKRKTIPNKSIAKPSEILINRSRSRGKSFLTHSCSFRANLRSLQRCLSGLKSFLCSAVRPTSPKNDATKF